MRALGAHVGADDKNIAVRAHIGNLFGNRFMVVQIHNAIVCAGRRGQAVGVLRIGEIAERDAVDGLVGVVVIGLQIVKAIVTTSSGMAAQCAMDASMPAAPLS